MSINDICKLGNFIKEIKGLKKNSVSLTDTWLVYFEKPISINNIHNISSGFMKIFINPYSTKLKKDSDLYSLLSSLDYENKVYNQVSKLIINEISPCFVLTYAYGDCSYYDLYSMLKKQKIPEENLIRNIYFMLNIVNQDIIRPPINKISSKKYISDINQIKDYRYNIIMNEISNNYSLFQWIKDNWKDKFFLCKLMLLLFQIGVGCYALDLSKITHYDLHSNNVFIEYTKEDYYIYKLDREKYLIIKTRYIPRIYDFDRCYSKRLGNNLLLSNNKSLCKKYFTCNKNIENYDIFYLIKSIQEILYEFFTDKYDKDFKKILKISTTEQLCYYIYDNYLYNIKTIDNFNKDNSKNIKISVCNKDVFYNDGNINIEKLNEIKKEILKDF